MLLSSFLMNAIGYVGLYALMRWHIVHEISELIERHDQADYSELVLTENQMGRANGQFFRINEHEFRYKGKMYDVVSQKQVGTSIHYTVIHDQKDELNFYRLATDTDLQDQSHQANKTQKTDVLDTMVKSLFAPLYFPSSTSNTEKRDTVFFIAYCQTTLPEIPYLRVPVPPPKAA